MKASGWILVFCFSTTVNVIVTRQNMLLLWFDVSIDVHLNIALMIQFSICYIYIVITSINNVTLASTIDLVQSPSVTYTRIILRRHSFLSSVSAYIRALLWHRTIGREREKDRWHVMNDVQQRKSLLTII
jgi:hypothetical protein